MDAAAQENYLRFIVLVGPAGSLSIFILSMRVMLAIPPTRGSHVEVPVPEV